MLHFYEDETTALFINGSNFYATAKALDMDVDYRKMLDFFRSRCYLLRAYYYTALSEDQEYSSIRPLIDWLNYNGYHIVSKTVKEMTDSQGRKRFKGNMDIELAVDALTLTDSVDHFVIFNGDGDLRRLVEALQQKGKKVSVVSTVTTQPPMIADELRRQVDMFIDLKELEKYIARPAGERPQHD